MKLTGLLALAVSMSGGISGLIATAVSAATKNKVDLSPAGIETANERAFTLSKDDHDRACAKLGITDAAFIVTNLEQFQVAGTQMGAAFAALEEKAAHLE